MSGCLPFSYFGGADSYRC